MSGIHLPKSLEGRLRIATVWASVVASTVGAIPAEPCDVLATLSGSCTSAEAPDITLINSVGALTNAPLPPQSKSMRTRLDEIIIPEIGYAGLTLDVVAADLIKKAHEHDPKNRPLHFLFSQIKSSAKRPELRETIINLHPPLKNASMRQVLDAVVRNSSIPIRYVMEEYGIVFEPADRSLMENPNTVASSTWKTAKNPSTIRRQLDSIVIPDLAYDSLTLAEVIFDMMYCTTREDPVGDGLRFMFAAPRGAINQPQPARMPVPVLPTLGDPPPGMPIPYGIDLSSVLINLPLPMFKLKLREVLDAVVRTADQPIKYTVLDYAVQFAPESLQTSGAIAQPASMQGPEAQGTQALLRETTTPMIAFDAFYLEGVVSDLNNQLRRRNKDTKVRFTIREDIIAKKPLRYLLAFFQTPAFDLNLEQTLDAILRTSVYEIAYSIDGHRVEFHLPNVKEK